MRGRESMIRFNTWERALCLTSRIPNSLSFIQTFYLKVFFVSSSFFQFLEGATIEVDQIHTHMRPLLMMLGDYRSLTLNVVNRLTSVTRLFPNSFNDKFCDQMMVRSSQYEENTITQHVLERLWWHRGFELHPILSHRFLYGLS